MKIFFINSNKVWGGGEKWNFETARHMQQKGYRISILTTPESELWKKSKNAGLPVMPFRVSNLSFINPFSMFRMMVMFYRTKPDAIILTLSADLKAAGIAARLTGVKRIVYRRGMALPIRDNFLNRFLFGRIITDVIANSEETKRTLLARNSDLFPSEKVNVIYNGIDLDQFDRVKPRELRNAKNVGITIGTVGRLEPEKNHQSLIHICKILLKKGVQVRLVIAGKGSLEQELKRLAEAEGISENVEFPGFIDPIPDFLNNIDIFVLPSLYEGFGYVKIEAMACRKPVVAFNISSNPEVVIDGENGFLIKMNDLADFSDKLRILAENPGLREKMGENGRRLVEQVFDIRHSLVRFEELLGTSPGQQTGS
jgi:glycosyltransferase involved in cell wall biosynthesis